ncbi:hypothetical protein Tco_0593256 [Tanacetum coccineum]
MFKLLQIPGICLNMDVGFGVESLFRNSSQKVVYEESISRTCCMKWVEKLIRSMHTTMVPVQVKTLKIQAGVQVSRPGELRRHLQLWKCLLLEDFYFCCILIQDRNIESKSVRILQKSQENGQNRTNTDTGKEREYKSRENAIKGQQKSTLGQPKSTTK